MTRSVRGLASMILAAALIAAACTPSQAGIPGLAAHLVAGGLNAPVGFTFGPSGKIWYVEKSTGEIHVYNPATDADRLFYTVARVNADGERGTLGIALHPSFPAKPFVYVYLTRTVSGHLRNQIVRLTDRHGSGAALTTIFSAPASSSPYHNGGRIEFGPDGMLYAFVGDGHNSANAQDLTKNNRGKVLRMTPAGKVPADNPLAGKKIFSYGNRNSFGFAFDPVKGNLWETENGPECNDELNLIVGGDNYGWGPHETCSGSAPGNTNQDGPSPVLPKWFFGSTIGITGMAFCDGCGLGSAAEGTFLFGEVNGGAIRQVTLNPARDDIASGGVHVVYTHSGPTISYEVGPDGAIYFSDFGGIYKLVTM